MHTVTTVMYTPYYPVSRQHLHEVQYSIAQLCNDRSITSNADRHVV
jgi:hypothetical protein